MKRSVKFLFYITAGFILFVFISARFTNLNTKLLGFPQRSDSLKIVIDESLKGSTGRYGIFIKNLKTGESFKQFEDETFEAGSLYKLWVMATIFEKIKKGEIKEDDPLETDISALNRRFGIASEEAELKSGIINFTVSSAIEQMITISHNYAALSLLTKANQEEVESYTKTLGLKNSTMELPLRTTAEDIGIFFEKLYKGEIVNPEYSKEMIEILKRQKISDRIPKYLPEGTVVAHKTGDIGSFENDGGIVFSDKSDYIIVVLSKSDIPAAAADRIGRLSRGVWDYFR